MRIASGVTDQVIYFVAVDATDLNTRETGLTGFTVQRSRNGSALTAMTTPTVTEVSAANAPGVYTLLLDEDMTIGAGNETEAMMFHITATGMAPVTREIELYRPKITSGNTLGVAADGDLLEVNTLTGHTVQTGDSFARLGAPSGASIAADIGDVPTVTEFNARTLPAAAYFDPAADTVANVTTVATLTGHTPQTGDSFARLGAPVGASLSADIAVIDANVDAIPARFDGIEGATFSSATDSLEAIRDRGDAAWITGGGGGITQSLNVQPMIPPAIDLANTATWRLGLMLVNALDDLPTTAEITPGTINIDRKAQGATSWTSVVSGAACSEAAGLVYFDEVFDSASGYAAGDMIRITFLGQSITADSNTYEISDGTEGRTFSSGILNSAPNVNMTQIGGSSTAADNLRASTLGIIQGTAQTGTLSTTQATTSLTGYADGELVGAEIIFTGGVANGQRSRITAYASAGGLVTYNTITTAPANADTFVVV